MSVTFADLLASLAGAPALPGARCRGRGHLFDDAHPGEHVTTTEDRQRMALGLCAGCPSLERCGIWLISLPPGRRPRGIVAGMRVDNRGIIRPGTRRPHTEATA